MYECKFFLDGYLNHIKKIGIIINLIYNFPISIIVEGEKGEVGVGDGILGVGPNHLKTHLWRSFQCKFAREMLQNLADFGGYIKLAAGGVKIKYMFFLLFYANDVLA